MPTHGGNADHEQKMEINMKNSKKIALAALLVAVSLAAPVLAADPISGHNTGALRNVDGSNTWAGSSANGGVWKTSNFLTNEPGGGENALIGLLNTDPTGRKPGELVPAVTPTEQKVQKVNGLGSLSGLGSTNDLFANSRGGDQGPGLLLPAVQKVRKAGGGGDQSSAHPGGANFQFGDGSVRFGDGGGGTGKTLGAAVLGSPNGAGVGGASPHVKVFSGNAATASGGPHVTPGAVKGLNFTNTAR